MLPTHVTPGTASHSQLPEVLGAFAKLGWISFGGPAAHLGYFREEFVRKRRWLDDDAYADLISLSQFLPGPGSSQMVFALGMHRAGWPGAILASACFILPSALLMILFGIGLSVFGSVQGAGWLHGLKLAAVAVVAHAIWGMGRRLCPDVPRLLIALAAAGLLLKFPGAGCQVAAIFSGAVAGWLVYRKQIPSAAAGEPISFKHHAVAAAALSSFFALLLALPWFANASGIKAVAVFDSFYRAGALVFGGGHVVLPLLRAEVVPPGWISDDAFLAGYGAAQALPGPLFTLAAYLGTAMHPGPYAWLSGLECLVAIFLPGWLLISGTLPLWHQLRAKSWAQAALRGTNSVVVGLLLAALYNPVGLSALGNLRDAAAAVIAFVLLERFKCPAWLLVLLCAAAGQWIV